MTTPATSPARVIVPGEEELGVQKLCPRCGDPWPADEEFYQPRPRGGIQSWCRACYNDSRIGKQKRRVA